jgi:hypothetical protein
MFFALLRLGFVVNNIFFALLRLDFTACNMFFAVQGLIGGSL